jgi:hypothetical protein
MHYYMRASWTHLGIHFFTRTGSAACSEGAPTTQSPGLQVT